MRVKGIEETKKNCRKEQVKRLVQKRASNSKEK